MMSRVAAVFLAAAAMLVGGPSLAQAQNTQQIAEQAFQSTVLLVVEGQYSESLGSGFFVRDSQVVTNFHVVDGAVEGYAKLVGQEARYPIKGVTATDPSHDLAVLKVDIPDAETMTLADKGTVQVGEPVYAVGNPKGLEGTFSEGIVSSIRQVDRGRLLQITAPISSGSSGGPVLNADGAVVGVSVGAMKEGQNLNFAIPSPYVDTLVQNAGEVRPLVSVSDARARSASGESGAEASDADESTSDTSVDHTAISLPDTWKGTYVCGQGRTGLTLRLEATGETNPNSKLVQGTVEFYPISENPDVPKGSYRVAGQIRADGLVDLSGEEWINRPDGYIMEDIFASLSDDNSKIEGTVCRNELMLERQ